MTNDANGSYEFTTSIEIDAPPDLVYRFFTEAELLERWHCLRAEVDATPGGQYTFDVTGVDVSRGEFLEMDPGKRLVMTWGFETPGSSTLELVFQAKGRGTLLELRHFGFETEENRDGHGRGWAHYMGRLRIAAGGGDPGPDSWRKTDESRLLPRD